VGRLVARTEARSRHLTVGPSRILRAVARLILASRGIPRLADHLRAPGPRAVLVPTASNPLNDPGIAEEVEEELSSAGLAVARVDLEDDAPSLEAIRAADVIAVSGGDPFHLLLVARRTNFGPAARAALANGAVYVGYSAGAMVAGPTLGPLRLTSPFDPPDATDLTGLRLTDVLILPHDNRPGRAERNAAAVAAYGGQVRLIVLRDGEFVVQDGPDITVVPR
jgi:dipeptidase E